MDMSEKTLPQIVTKAKNCTSLQYISPNGQFPVSMYKKLGSTFKVETIASAIPRNKSS